MFYRRALHSQRKGSLSMREFLVKIKGFCANLASCGEVISDHEHVTAILNSLPPEYESVVTIITASPVPYNAQGCQLCGKQGHLVDRCYYRFDASYKSTGYKPPPPSQANICMYGTGSSMVHWVSSPVPFSNAASSTPSGWYFPPVPNWPHPVLATSSPPVSATPPATTPPQALIATPEIVDDNAWYPDSGATHHLTHSASSVGESTTYNSLGKVYVGNGNALPVLSTSQSSLLTRTRPLYMRSLLFVPGITKNLLSVSKFTKDNQVIFEFLPQQCQVRDLKTREVLLRGSVQNGLYKLHLHGTYPNVLSSGSAQCFTASSNVSLNVWHARLGHPCKSILTNALANCNTSGPAPICSNGFRYYVAFTDAFTRYTWVYFLTKKSEVLTVFPLFHRRVERTLGCKLKTLQTDGGGEFQVLRSYLSLQGIVHRLSCPYSSAQNGIVERKHRQIVEAGLSMLAHTAMPLTYWHDAFSTAVYLINRLPSHFLANLSPYEKLFQVSPDYSCLRTFGCMCFPNLRPYNTHKLHFRSTHCTFLGYSPYHKGYRCQDANGRIYVSRHVTFNETDFPFKTIPTKSAPISSTPQTSSKLFVLSSSLSSTPTSTRVLPPTSQAPSLVNSCLPTQSPSTNSISCPSNTISSTPLHSPPSVSHISPPSPPCVAHNFHPMITRSKAGVFKPKAYMSTASSLSEEVPADIHAAMANESWKAAVHNELHALIQNRTWSLCPLPSNRRAIGCKWLFKVKTKADGSVDKYKARLVAKGFSQHAGLDFQDTFSPVVRAATIRIVLAIAVMKGWALRQVDVNNAFLNGELSEEIYMTQPPGFEEVGSSGQKLVCKLHKALYGLRQAPRAWFQTLRQYLECHLGFHASKVDPSLFIRSTSGSYLLLMAYVDDIVITGSSRNDIDDVVLQLHQKFALKDMGQLNFFLGIAVHRTSQGGLLLTQKKYVAELLHKAGMSGASATPTPMVSTPKLVAIDGSPSFADQHLFRSIVGMLQYVCITRPDLSFCVNKLSQYMNSPSDTHWKALKRVLRYLIGTIDYGLLLSKGKFELVCYSDADWASSVEDRRSTSGYVVYLGSSPIVWCSKKQPVVSRSSSEAEYRSLANCVSELLWVKQLLNELGLLLCRPPVIWCDNTSTVSMAANPTHHAKVKHVEIDHHFVREKVLDGTLQVNFVPSEKQIADVLTKPITPKAFASFRTALQVFSSADVALMENKDERNQENVSITNKS
ncbi:hypothetical protein CXB51_007144 [Gossypium anomalum]|uniref:Integrase catalytic domain-containing protein n=1 Tax=Gossypium anomalum TaxID=47600 RepID=A0A8J5ZDX6_9ROSI|nr:hypothetical protein CXB51_007144 [Gossypium anomalum]